MDRLAFCHPREQGQPRGRDSHEGEAANMAHLHPESYLISLRLSPRKGTMKSRAADTPCELCNPYGHFGHFKGANFTLKGAIIEVVVERYEPISEAFMTASVLRLQNDSSHF
jgi:hypothetical protein